MKLRKYLALVVCGIAVNGSAILLSSEHWRVSGCQSPASDCQASIIISGQPRLLAPTRKQAGCSSTATSSSDTAPVYM